MNADRRLAEVRRRLVEAGVDAFVAHRPPNVAYLTGFDDVFDEEPASLALVTPAHSVLFVDSRYHEAASLAAVGTQWHVRGPYPDVWESAVTEVGARGAVTLGLESTLEHRRFARIAERFDGTVVPMEETVEAARLVKEDHEIERISAAAEIADAAFDHVLGVIAPGVAERDIALELEIHMRRQGSDGIAFPPIVAGGPNSSRPHARAGDRPVAVGDLVVLDFGARVGGYCSDMTRTVVVGSATDGQRALYETVRAANEAGVAALAAGRYGREIDAAARSIIEQAGHGGHFGHGLGHGVGLEVHEAPRLGQKAEDVVPAGAVVTVEPGVYLPGVGGVRIEDLVVVGEAGCTVLTRAPRDLIEL